MPDPIHVRGTARQTPIMRRIAITSAERIGAAPRRDPAHELYDRACDLVAAAAELRAASADCDGDAAVAATLGSLGAALGDIAAAVDGLRCSSVLRISSAWPAFGEGACAEAGDASIRFDAASAAIRAAAGACDDARREVGPLLAELSPR